MLRATSTGLTLADSTTFNITPAASDHLAFLQQPTTAVAGVAISPAVKLYARQLLDDHGRTDRDLHDLETRLKLPEKPPPQDTTKAELAHLKARFAALPRGLAFDTAFVNHEAEDHVNDIKETKDLAAKASKNRCCVMVASFGLRFSNFQP